MEEGPKLYVNKPKKAQMKQVKGIDAQSSSSSAAAISSYYSSGSSSNGSGGGVSKPPEVPKESFAKRYKYIWPLLLTVNLAIGAYFFMRTRKKDGGIEEGHTNASPGSDMATSVTPPNSISVTEDMPVGPVAQHARVLKPIPEQQQRELFKWMLEEKRKIKTNDPVEKKRIDEEKAILKQFIRAKSIPSF
ncbi:uncharacterized protein LOC141622809 isoform X2 [Silene latifolia]|uniref:uncharacterized protein LOC141622809 isoform X2 n=1 Tax=Silene latifolia TaxID=37657 RepID=UPI003D7701F0